MDVSQYGWREQQDEPTAFVKYLLDTIIAVYRDFDERIQIISLTLLDTVKNAINNKLGKFAKRDILELRPCLSASTIERHLKHLTADGYIIKLGAGKNTAYAKK